MPALATLSRPPSEITSMVLARVRSVGIDICPRAARFRFDARGELVHVELPGEYRELVPVPWSQIKDNTPDSGKFDAGKWFVLTPEVEAVLFSSQAPAPATETETEVKSESKANPMQHRRLGWSDAEFHAMSPEEQERVIREKVKKEK